MIQCVPFNNYIRKEWIFNNISFAIICFNVIWVTFIIYKNSDWNNGWSLVKTAKSRELPTKKVTENPSSTNHLISFITWIKSDLLLYFFKELQVFLFLLIPILYFVSFYRRMNLVACLLSVFINSFSIFCLFL